jgi:hypothetical protein
MRRWCSRPGRKVALSPVLAAGVPVRIGPFSKWWSWLCYNLGRSQNRSAVEMHEADYNIQLAAGVRRYRGRHLGEDLPDGG